MSPSRPLERLIKRIFFSSIIFLKSKDDFSWAIMGRIISLPKKLSNLLVIYGTMLAKDASPPAFSATSFQNNLTDKFRQRESFRSLNALLDITLDISRSVLPDSGS